MSKPCYQKSDQKKHYICKQLANSPFLPVPVFHQSLLYALESRHHHRYDVTGIMLHIHKGFSHTNAVLLRFRKRQAGVSTPGCGMIPRVHLGLTSSPLNATSSAALAYLWAFSRVFVSPLLRCSFMLLYTANQLVFLVLDQIQFFSRNLSFWFPSPLLPSDFNWLRQCSDFSPKKTEVRLNYP